MRIVEITGGLGNQMFQYAFGQYLKHRFPDDSVKYDIEYFQAESAIRSYSLNSSFGISADIASKREIRKIRGYSVCDNRLQRAVSKIISQKGEAHKEFKENLDLRFDEIDICNDDNVYFSGYWQCEGYFKLFRNEIINSFTPQLDRVTKQFRNVIEDIENCNSVAVHVRLDDYLDHNNFKVYGDICTEQYYELAIEHMNCAEPGCKYFLFTTDVDQAIKLLPKDVSFVPVIYEGQKDYLDMYLMSRCKHNIIANSSFSWWGAWLNQNFDKMVLCPERWFNNHEVYNQFCDGWIKVK